MVLGGFTLELQLHLCMKFTVEGDVHVRILLEDGELLLCRNFSSSETEPAMTCIKWDDCP